MSRYPAGLLEFVKEHYLTMDNRALAQEVVRVFGYPMTTKSMKTLKSNHHLSGGKRLRAYTPTYPERVCQFIEDSYMGTGYEQMRGMVNDRFGTNYSKEQIKSYYKNHHLNSGLKGDLEKGRGWNKGKKMSPEQYAKCKGTMFKKGNRPHNAVPVGTEVARGDGYHQTKVAEPDKWILTHILTWQQAYGDVPEGCLVSFKDGNPDHISIDNLFLETRQEHLEMNQRGYRSEFPEITEAGLNVAKLRIAARHKSDKRKKKEAQPMAKRTKEKPVILTADKFKEIKHMDRTQLEKYLIEIYLRGSRDAQAAAGFDIDKALEAISQIKGFDADKALEAISQIKGFDADKALEAISQIKGIGTGKLKEIERVLKGAANGNETQ